MPEPEPARTLMLGAGRFTHVAAGPQGKGAVAVVLLFFVLGLGVKSPVDVGLFDPTTKDGGPLTGSDGSTKVVLSRRKLISSVPL